MDQRKYKELANVQTLFTKYYELTKKSDQFYTKSEEEISIHDSNGCSKSSL